MARCAIFGMGHINSSDPSSRSPEATIACCPRGGFVPGPRASPGLKTTRQPGSIHDSKARGLGARARERLPDSTSPLLLAIKHPCEAQLHVQFLVVVPQTDPVYQLRVRLVWGSSGSDTHATYSI